MSIFVVFRVTKPEAIRTALEGKYSTDFFDLGNNEWLVSDKGTAKEVSDKIGITAEGSPVGSAIVFSMGSYFGRASADIWDWIKAKTEAVDG